MTRSTRREFVIGTATGIAASTLLQPTPLRAGNRAERIRIGVIGCGNQGETHVSNLLNLEDAEIVYVCDVDEQRLAERVQQSGGAKGVTDLRRILDDNTIDAVTIATPDHWHAPAALLAMDAGKHVYVEKPCSHSLHEGRMLVEAAKRHNKVVAHGTQTRSSAGFQQAMQLLRDGVIGDVLIAKCWNWQRRKNIGHLKPSDPPAGVDYDAWVGPAAWMPYQENRFHYNWHWWHNFGCGGMGNDGIHELDYALWGLGIHEHPSLISAVGGKYYFDDDQQFPDTQQVSLEFPGEAFHGTGGRRLLIYEQRLWSTTYPFNVDSGAEFFGTDGRMFLSKRGKFQVVGNRNRRLDTKLQHDTKSNVAENQQNWIDCIKSGGVPNASIEIAHRTAAAVHLGNLATRLQRTIRFDPNSEQIVDDDQANAMLARSYRQDGHWAIPNVR